MKPLQPEWKTKRCVVTEAHERDLPTLAAIFADNANAVRSQGPDCTPERLASVLLRHEALPPNGDPSREYTFLIAEGESREVIGLLSVYCGYPKSKTLYIGSLFFRRKW
ncbi:GNAT family N-acetyltransferase, partial [Candidatus Hydrogenedentota bacterium]